VLLDSPEGLAVLSAMHGEGVGKPSRMIRIDVQNDPRNVPPVGAFLMSIEHPHISDGVFFIVCGESWLGRGNIGAIWIQRRALHGPLT
jgi:hypothetical protein